MNRSKTGRLTAILLIATILCVGMTGTAAAEKKGTVIGGWLILRDAPSYQGNQLSSYPSGTVVTITGQKGSWYAVKAPDGLKGYMLGSYLNVSGSDVVVGKDAWVTSSNGMNVRLRSGPGTQYAAIASYAPGTKCKVLAQSGSFYKIQIGTYTGYMMGKYLTGSGEDPEPTPLHYTVYVTSRNGDGVYLRSGAYKGDNVIGFFAVGTKATMLAAGKTWSRISIEGLEGYMMSTFLTTKKPTPGPEPSPTGAYVYSPNGRNVNLRTGPGTEYPSLKSCAPGTEVTIVSRGDIWYFIMVGDLYGYMMGNYIQED